jgi:hypothetical protein
VRPADRQPDLRLAPAPDPFALEGDDLPGTVAPPAQPAASRRHDLAMLDGLARACWPMHLYAVLGNEVGRAVEAGVLTLAEAESLVARLTVVIDQAIGVDDD